MGGAMLHGGRELRERPASVGTKEDVLRWEENETLTVADRAAATGCTA